MCNFCELRFAEICSESSEYVCPILFHVRKSLSTIDYAQQCDLYTCHASDLHPHKANNGVTKRPSSDVEELSSLDAASPRSLEGRNADKPSDDAAWCYPTKGPMACAKNYIASFDKGKIKTNACK